MGSVLPFPKRPQVIRDYHSASAAERGPCRLLCQSGGFRAEVIMEVGEAETNLGQLEAEHRPLLPSERQVAVLYTI